MVSTRRERFDEIGAFDAPAMLKPTVPTLVVTDTEEAGPNVMTASWWMLAGYDPFRFLLAVSQKSYTFELIEENPAFVMAVPTTAMIDAVTLAGMVSGRDLDKIDHLDLETVPAKEIDVPLLADAVGNIELSVLDSFSFEGITYYFGGVEAAHVVSGGMNGRLLSLDTDVLAYMGSDWVDETDTTKNRFYASLGPEDLVGYPGDEVLETLPPELRARFEE